MGETTCVMHAFSYTSTGDESNKRQQGDHMYALGESVSLGRFMSESLAWEKWSSFSRNHYVEEAEKYSKPGSVAQKKAYFEAHFKRMAALKAAALLEQANATKDAAQAKVEVEVVDHISREYDPQQLRSVSRVGVIDRQNVRKEAEKEMAAVNHNAVESVAEMDESCLTSVEEADSAEEVPSSEHLEDDGNLNGRAKMELTGKTQMEKLPVQEVDYVKQNSDSSVEASMKIRKKNPPLSSFMPLVESRGPRFSTSPAKSPAALHLGKENYYPPIGKKSPAVDDLDKKRTPLRMSINKELTRLISPVMKKLAGSSKASKKCCSSPLGTPSRASWDDVPNPPSATPLSAKKGARRLFNFSPRGNKPVGARWNFVSEDGPKSPSTYGSKTDSTTTPKSFCLRNGQRAGRRKEKLEEKFSGNVTEKPQHQSKFKEKAEAELTKLRGSFCLNVKAPSEYYGQTEARKSPMQKSPKKGSKPSGGTLKSTNCLPRRNLRAVPKGRSSKHVQQMNG
ncbi:hypothetical protein Ancab_002693 [Ancistrocladus abbreviatus]